MSWADPLPDWYSDHGRHSLPWRHTGDPWAILVSEVMLAQTPVSRVLGRWEQFLERWPDPPTCAGARLDDLLRAWQGLGYPRRALYLYQCAALVVASGWPQDEAGLRALPGVGEYTARALLTFAWERPAGPPREVNLARVAARAVLGIEPHQAPARGLDAVLETGRPRSMSPRHWAYALFDLGATRCRARAPRCSACPLAAGCRSRERLAVAAPAAPPWRQAAYKGSVRQLRGAILAAALGPRPPRTASGLRRRVRGIPAASRPGSFEAALDGLRRDGLIPADCFVD